MQQQVEDLEDNQLISLPVSGTELYLSDSAGAQNRGIGIIGRSTQDGTPTSTSSAPIKNTGDDGYINEKKQNKNEFDKDNTTILNQYITADGVITASSGTNAEKSFVFPCKPNTTYTISKLRTYRFRVAESTSNFVVGNTYNVLINDPTATNVTKTFTTGNDIKNIFVFFRNNTGETYTQQQVLDSIQIEEGSTATPYVEHKEQLINFPLTEGQNFYEGDYLADDGIHDLRNQIQLTGNETIIKRDNTQHSFNISGFGRVMDGICSHYISFTATSQIDNMDGIYLRNTYVIIVTDTRFTTVEEFKAFLAQQYANGTPVTILCKLPSEVIVPYTSEQQAVWNEIKALRTYKGGTHISSSNTVPPTVNIVYVRDLETVINELSSAIVAQGGV